MDIMTGWLVLLVLVISGVKCSIKKGLGVDPRKFKCDDFKALNNSNWWYDWGANFDIIESESKCAIGDQYKNSYVPMIWGYRSTWSSRLREIDGTSTNKFLLGFNEPNHGEQSNLTPQQAANAWPIVENIAKENGRKLVSPAAAVCGTNCVTPDHMVWFTEFFKLICNGVDEACRVDYIAFHHYPGKCKASQTYRKLEEIYLKYSKPIWLTEFACPGDFSTTAQEAYMTELLPMLEQTEMVYKYAWFAHRIDSDAGYVKSAASLLEKDSSTLTNLGKVYNDFWNPSAITTTTSSSTTTSTSTSSSTTSATSTPAGSTVSTTTPKITTVDSHAVRSVSLYRDVVCCVLWLFVIMIFEYELV